jgi:hypothetical protein
MIPGSVLSVADREYFEQAAIRFFKTIPPEYHPEVEALYQGFKARLLAELWVGFVDRTILR